MAECFPEKSSWYRNKHVCFEWSNGLDTALCKTYLFTLSTKLLCGIATGHRYKLKLLQIVATIFMFFHITIGESGNKSGYLERKRLFKYKSIVNEKLKKLAVIKNSCNFNSDCSCCYGVLASSN